MQKNEQTPYLTGFLPFALGAFLVGIVGGFTTVLGPAFVKDLNLNYNNTTWTALALAISTAACAPILGKLGDMTGRRPMLLIGIAVFTFGNILTAIAPSLLFMLAARFIVGLGSAAIAPVVISYIVAEFPPEKQAKGFSLYMLISSCAVIFGPTLGGLLIEYYGWRVMMWVCVSICVVVFLICCFMRGGAQTPRHSGAEFDYAGAVFVLIFFGLLLCIPSFGQNIGWNTKTFRAISAAAVLAFLGLCFTEKKATNPILQWDFIKRKKFILSVAVLFLTQGLMQANMTNIIVFVNYMQMADNVISGYAISIMYIGMSLGAVILGPLTDKYEPKNILVCSLAFTGLGCAAMLLFSGGTPAALLALSLGILGFGLGGNGTIFMKIVLSGVPAETVSTATGTYGLFRDLSAPFGVAVLVPMFTNRITEDMKRGADGITAAVNSVKQIGIIELACVAVGIFIVLLLPKIYQNKQGEKNEIR